MWRWNPIHDSRLLGSLVLAIWGGGDASEANAAAQTAIRQIIKAELDDLADIRRIFIKAQVKAENQPDSDVKLQAIWEDASSQIPHFSSISYDNLMGIPSPSQTTSSGPGPRPGPTPRPRPASRPRPAPRPKKKTRRARRPRRTTTCQMDDCDIPSRGKPLCRKHYYEAIDKPYIEFCQHPGCGQPSHGQPLCREHYRGRRRRGRRRPNPLRHRHRRYRRNIIPSPLQRDVSFSRTIQRRRLTFEESQEIARREAPKAGITSGRQYLEAKQWRNDLGLLGTPYQVWDSHLRKSFVRPGFNWDYYLGKTSQRSSKKIKELTFEESQEIARREAPKAEVTSGRQYLEAKQWRDELGLQATPSRVWDSSLGNDVRRPGFSWNYYLGKTSQRPSKIKRQPRGASFEESQEIARREAPKAGITSSSQYLSATAKQWRDRLGLLRSPNQIWDIRFGKRVQRLDFDWDYYLGKTFIKRKLTFEESQQIARLEAPKEGITSGKKYRSRKAKQWRDSLGLLRSPEVVWNSHLAKRVARPNFSWDYYLGRTDSHDPSGDGSRRSGSLRRVHNIGYRKNPDFPFPIPPEPTGWKECELCSFWWAKFQKHAERWKAGPELGFVCEEHSPSPKIEYTMWPVTRFIGGFVKLAFPIPPAISQMAQLRFGRGAAMEHLWIGVTGLAEHPDEELHGIVFSVPRFAYPTMSKDEIEFSRSEIEEFLEGPER